MVATYGCRNKSFFEGRLFWEEEEEEEDIPIDVD